MIPDISAWIENKIIRIKYANQRTIAYRCGYEFVMFMYWTHLNKVLTTIKRHMNDKQLLKLTQFFLKIRMKAGDLVEHFK